MEVIPRPDLQPQLDAWLTLRQHHQGLPIFDAAQEALKRGLEAEARLAGAALKIPMDLRFPDWCIVVYP